MHFDAWGHTHAHTHTLTHTHTHSLTHTHTHREENLRIAQENLRQKEPLAQLREDLLAQHEILQVRKLE